MKKTLADILEPGSDVRISMGPDRQVELSLAISARRQADALEAIATALQPGIYGDHPATSVVDALSSIKDRLNG